jgi:hypothetical protein
VIDQDLKDAYYEHLDRLARAGILDHSLDRDVATGLTIEEHMRKTVAEPVDRPTIRRID